MLHQKYLTNFKCFLLFQVINFNFYQYFQINTTKFEKKTETMQQKQVNIKNQSGKNNKSNLQYVSIQLVEKEL